MYDFKLQQTENAPADLTLTDENDFELTDSLETYVQVCYFTDKRETNIEIIPDGINTLGGFFGDILAGYSIGSKLWLLKRSNLTNEFFVLATQYLTESLQPLIDDSLITSATVTVTKSTVYTNSIIIDTILYTQTQTKTLQYIFNYKTQTLLEV